MARISKLQRIHDAVVRGEGVIKFRDLEALLAELGFKLARQVGSHHIYVHPNVERPFPIQPDGTDAKRYQIRQLRDIMKKYALKLSQTG